MTEEHDHLMRDPLVRTFGSVLRGYREGARLSRPQLAEALGCSPQWIEKLETARKPPSRETAEDLDTYFKTPRTFYRMWEEIDRLGRRRVLPAWFMQWLEIERVAHTLKNWEPLLIPGLLQTPEYARAVISRQPGLRRSRSKNSSQRDWSANRS